MSKKLFKDFSPVSAKQWKQQIQMDLKGADYNQTLVHTTPEGINIKPFYHRDSYKSAGNVPNLPDNWTIVQAVFVDDLKIAQRLIKEAIAGGATAIWLTATKVFNHNELIQGLELKRVEFYADFKFLDLGFYTAFKTTLDKAGAIVQLRLDLLGNLAASGNWFKDNNSDHQTLQALWETHKQTGVIGVNAELYANAGANTVQQLAYSLAHLNEYLNFFKNDKGNLTAKPEVCFTVAIGGNYFMEIAKLRALRLLVKVLSQEYKTELALKILATPALRNKTIYDPNVNMLRTTTECMSAALGGANAICNQPYDVVYHKSNDFGERISRNQLLILKHESYFDAVSNPADGSYYIEELTQELSEKSLKLFKEIEAAGGFLQALHEGTIQRKIKEQATLEQNRFENGDITLLGTNLYQNAEEKVKETLELYPFVKKQVRKTLIEPIIRKRLSELNEQNRLENE